MSESTRIPDAGPSRDRLDQIIEIRDPSIDVERVMAEIRATLQRHAPPSSPSVPNQEALAEDDQTALAFLLQQAQFVHDRVWIEADAPPTEVSAMRRLAALAKRAAHEMAVYYVNKHAGQQVYFNATVVRVLRLLAARDADCAAMREEIAEMRRRIQDLESRG